MREVMREFMQEYPYWSLLIAFVLTTIVSIWTAPKPRKSVPANRGAGHINRSPTPFQHYSAQLIQKAWLGGVTGVDITALRHIGNSVEADFVYRGRELHATVSGFSCSEEKMMKVLAAKIEYVKIYALGGTP